MNRTVIISGGNIDSHFALDFLKNNPYDYLIGADSGIEFLADFKLKPTHIVGDFDSAPESALSYFKRCPDVAIHTYRPEKDWTDTQIAVDLAMELGSGCICILGGTGTRIDHVLANIRVLSIPMKRGIDCYLIDKYNRIYLKSQGFSLKKQEQYGTYISFFALGGPVEGLTLRGFFYPLTEYLLYTDDPVCVSNEIIETEAEVLFKKGILIVVESMD